MIDLKDLSPMDVTPAERALIHIIRNLGTGYIEGLGVAGGQPNVLKQVTERVDLSKSVQLDEVLAAFDAKLLVPVVTVEQRREAEMNNRALSELAEAVAGENVQKNLEEKPQTP